jgi:hypothetical protein
MSETRYPTPPGVVPGMASEGWGSAFGRRRAIRLRRITRHRTNRGRPGTHLAPHHRQAAADACGPPPPAAPGYGRGQAADQAGSAPSVIEVVHLPDRWAGLPRSGIRRPDPTCPMLLPAHHRNPVPPATTTATSGTDPAGIQRTVRATVTTASFGAVRFAAGESCCPGRRPNPSLPGPRPTPRVGGSTNVKARQLPACDRRWRCSRPGLEGPCRGGLVVDRSVTSRQDRWDSPGGCRAYVCECG